MGADIISGRRGLALAAPALGGFAATGAGPAPGAVQPSPAEVMAKAFPTPRLYNLSTSHDGKPGPAMALCFGAEPFLKLLDAFRATDMGQKAKLQGDGCSHSVTHSPDGAMHQEMT